MSKVLLENITLYRGDALDVMEHLKQNGIKDLVVTDVPFGTTQCSWDSVIPFAPMWKAIDGVTNANTPILIHGAEPFSSMLRVSNIKNFKYDWVWDKVKGTGFLNAKIQPMRNHEFVSVFYKKQPTYNPQKTTGHKNKKTFRSKDLQTEVYGDIGKDYYYESTERYPRSIQIFSSDTQNSPLHPTQKPVALLEYFIKTYTNKGDLVLDFTMGSGTTMVACQNTGRRGIGIELEEKYFKIAQDRVLKTQGKVGLFA